MKVHFSSEMRYLNQMRKREDKKGGGLMIVWKESEHINMEKIENKNEDLMVIEGTINKMKIIFLLVYMSVNDAGKNLKLKKEIEEIITKYQNMNMNIIVLGDFNGHVGFLGKQKLDKNGKMILDHMEKFKLTLLNDVPECTGEITWQQGKKQSTIDYVLVCENLMKRFERMKIDEEREEMSISDHNLIEVTFLMDETQKQKEQNVEMFSILKINDVNKSNFIEDMKIEIAKDPELNLHKLNEVLKESANKCLKVTIRKKKNEERKEPIWMNLNIKKEINKRREINKNRRNTTNIHEKNRLMKEYEAQKNKVSRMVKEAIEIHEINITQKIITDKNRGKRVFQHINTLKNLNKNERKEIKLYDEQGEMIPEERIKDELIQKWTPIYQSSENDINRYWNNEEKEQYIRETESETINSTVYSNETSQDIQQEYIHKMNTPTITAVEVKERIKNMKNGKATGPDEVKAEIYKCIMEDNELINILTQQLNKVMNDGIIPNDWKNSKTILIEKNRKPKANEFRPIALTNTYYKIFMGILKNKLEKHLFENNLINDYQAGSTPGRRIEDNLFMLKYCIENACKKKKTLYIFSIDYSKAFDSIERGKMINILKTYKIHEKIINILSDIYQNDKTEIQLNGKTYTEMNVTSGIRQGCNGSALLFILVTYQIIKHIKNLKLGYREGNIEIPALFYVDDGLY